MSLPKSLPSTEPPSILQKNLEPVKLKYIPLPSPLAPLAEQAPSTIAMTANETFRPPCRRCLEDANPGEKLYLLSYDPFPEDSVTPYRGTGPIFVHADSCQVFQGDVLPEKQLRRQLSVRAYDEKHMLAAAETIEGKDFDDVVGRMLADEKARYVHVHNAKPGCFAVKVERRD